MTTYSIFPGLITAIYNKNAGAVLRPGDLLLVAETLSISAVQSASDALDRTPTAMTQSNRPRR